MNEWIPYYCAKCGRLDHEANKCGMKKKRLRKPVQTAPPNVQPPVLQTDTTEEEKVQETCPEPVTPIASSLKEDRGFKSVPVRHIFHRSRLFLSANKPLVSQPSRFQVLRDDQPLINLKIGVFEKGVTSGQSTIT